MKAPHDNEQAERNTVLHHPESHCPVCDTVFTATAPTTPADHFIVPTIGDWTICTKCLNWLVVTARRPDGGMVYRPITNAEWLELSAEERTHLSAERAKVKWAWEQPAPRKD